MERFEEYLKTIKSENTRNATKVICKKLDAYMDKAKIESVKDMTELTVDLFIKREYNGKSNTTISSFVSRIKDMFKFYKNYEAVEHLNLFYIQSIITTGETKYLSPSEVYDFIEKLINYQDKALVLLIYLGLYDDNFDTIRNLKVKQIKDGRIELGKDKFLELNEYCNNIIQNAIEEKEMEKYTISDVGGFSPSYELNIESPYLMKSRKRKNAATILPSATLKKRFEAFSMYLDMKVTPISIKNSKIIYDLVKLEYEINEGLDINQLELKNILKERGIVGSAEALNVAKKKMKLKVIRDIITEKDWFIN